MRVDIQTTHGPGTADLDRPRGGASALLVLTHGAGGGVETTDLLAIRAAALKAGIALARVTQPYRFAGGRTPSAPARQDTAWLEIVSAVRRRRGFGALPLVVGGRSNGARVASRTAQAAGAAGVVGLAYPLHPPGRPEKSRLDELDAAGVPTLVVQGDRDPFGMPPAGPDRTVEVVAGADHSLSRDPVAVATLVVRFVTALVADARVGS
ncbi:alpha/beta hydrolase family protein [Jatrophihabitans fulvus]